jgi:Spy/CpxP family protein refolding chaperone
MQAGTFGRRKIRLAAFAASAVLAMTGAVALAQPGGGPGYGPGPGHAGGMEIEHVLGSVKSQLNLNTSQQLMWDNAVTVTKRVHNLGRGNMQKVHDAMAFELTKDEPNLAAVAAVADSVHADNRTLRQGVRNQWLQVYANLSPEQKAIVRDALKNQMARMDAMAAKMKARMQPGG